MPSSNKGAAPEYEPDDRILGDEHGRLIVDGHGNLIGLKKSDSVAHRNTKKDQ
jgi:hypothetical protein